jgi:hypothetical protein
MTFMLTDGGDGEMFIHVTDLAWSLRDEYYPGSMSAWYQLFIQFKSMHSIHPLTR